MIFTDISGNIVDVNPDEIKNVVTVSTIFGDEDLSKTGVIFKDDSELILDSPYVKTFKALLWRVPVERFTD